MFLSEESVDLKTVCIANVCLFLALVLGHSIPPTFNMGKTGKKWFLIIFFGLLVGIAFNIVLPSSLHIVTDAWEAYQNSTKDNDTDIFFELLRRLDDDDDDDDDDSFRRIIGVAICFGFMVLFVAEFVSKQMTQKQRTRCSSRWWRSPRRRETSTAAALCATCTSPSTCSRPWAAWEATSSATAACSAPSFSSRRVSACSPLPFCMV